MKDVFEEIDGTVLYCVDSAEQGIESIFSDAPALVLMDIDLPGMNGFDAQLLLSKHPLTSHIPIIGISAGALEKDIARAKTSGFTEYVTKPFDIVEFIGLVENTLATVERP
jgi:CheY-like chemotaxis protein